MKNNNEEKNNCLKALMSEFKSYLYTLKNLSGLYIDGITYTIQDFLEYLLDYKFDNCFKSIEEITINEIRSITNNDIYSYMYYLGINGYDPRTRNNKTNHLKAFFDFFYRIKHELFKQPFKTFKSEKRAEFQLPNFLSFKEARSLLDLYSNSNKVNEIRNYAILNLCLQNGLRVSEIRNLNISDFHFSEDSFTIFGKGQKERSRTYD